MHTFLCSVTVLYYLKMYDYLNLQSLHYLKNLYYFSPQTSCLTAVLDLHNFGPELVLFISVVLNICLSSVDVSWLEYVQYSR